MQCPQRIFAMALLHWEINSKIVFFKIFLGEGKDVTNEMTAPWRETTLPTILTHYDPCNIFNADEFGLFYQALPQKTLHLKGEKCSGSKHSKIRLTGLKLHVVIVHKKRVG